MLAPEPDFGIIGFNMWVAWSWVVVYDWHGGRTRRRKLLKIVLSWLVAAIAVSIPALILMRFR